jgi:LemA protein
MIAVYVILGIVVILAVAAVLSYNRFVSQRQMIRDSYANIDTELKRRYDLIPNLVETVKGYAEHERGVFEAVTEARANAISAQGPAEQAQAENVLTGALRSLFAVAENYPTLKANENFLQLQGELSNTEDRIQTARRFYNNNVRDFNTRVQSFPASVIAGMFHFTQGQYFEIDEAVREAGPPKIDFSEAPPVQIVTPAQAPPATQTPGGSDPSGLAPPTPPAEPPVPPAPPTPPSPTQPGG